MGCHRLLQGALDAGVLRRAPVTVHIGRAVLRQAAITEHQAAALVYGKRPIRREHIEILGLPCLAPAVAFPVAGVVIVQRVIVRLNDGALIHQQFVDVPHVIPIQRLIQSFSVIYHHYDDRAAEQPRPLQRGCKVALNVEFVTLVLQVLRYILVVHADVKAVLYGFFGRHVDDFCKQAVTLVGGAQLAVQRGPLGHKLELFRAILGRAIPRHHVHIAVAVQHLFALFPSIQFFKNLFATLHEGKCAQISFVFHVFRS